MARNTYRYMVTMIGVTEEEADVLINDAQAIMESNAPQGRVVTEFFNSEIGWDEDEDCPPCADGEHSDDGSRQDCPCCGEYVEAVSE